jgi:hypothetical protein
VKQQGILTCGAIAALLAFASSAPSARAAVLSLGPRGVQTLVAEQLFNRKGRWYLIDDGGICYTYLDSPRTHLEADRLVLNAHLSSRLGQRIGNTCAGADFASNITLSGTLRATDRKLILDDIRIDRVDDESTRDALTLALQLAPQSLPRQASIDVLDLMRKQMVAIEGLPVRLDQFHILNVSARPESIAVQFDLILSTP